MNAWDGRNPGGFPSLTLGWGSLLSRRSCRLLGGLAAQGQGSWRWSLWPRSGTGEIKNSYQPVGAIANQNDIDSLCAGCCSICGQLRGCGGAVRPLTPYMVRRLLRTAR